jgi:hypothetical protein
MEQINDDISELYKLRSEYLRVNKRLKTRFKKVNNVKKDSELIMKHMVRLHQIISIREHDKSLVYDVKCEIECILSIPSKYKRFKPKPFRIIDNFTRRCGTRTIDIDMFDYRGAFLLSNNKIYLEKYIGKPEVYSDMKSFINKRYIERMEGRGKLDPPYYACKNCESKIQLNKLETFYELLSYQIAKSKGYGNIRCHCTISKEDAIRLIQKYVLNWLYSAPNGPMFVKDVKKLKTDGYLNVKYKLECKNIDNI